MKNRSKMGDFWGCLKNRVGNAKRYRVTYLALPTFGMLFSIKNNNLDESVTYLKTGG